MKEAVNINEILYKFYSALIMYVNGNFCLIVIKKN